MVISDPIVLRHILKENVFSYDKGVLSEILEPFMGQVCVWGGRGQMKTHTHACTHAHMHTCTHAHMHTFTHTNGRALADPRALLGPGALSQ